MTALGPGVRVKCIDGSNWGHIPGCLAPPAHGGPAAGSVWTIRKLWRAGTVFPSWVLCSV